MNRKLVLGTLSGLAAIALALGGTTYSAFTDFGQVDGNVAGAGFLKLDLGTDGQGDVAFDFTPLLPGSGTDRALWVASNDAGSSPDANLYLSFRNLVDHAGPCDTSRGKAIGEIASGVLGCTVTGDVVSGTPAQGNLSRVLTFHAVSYPGITDALACAAVQDSEPANSLLPAVPGNLRASASGNGGDGTRYQLPQADGSTPLLLAPGSGVCIGLAADWPGENDPPGRPSPDYPSDNAAQGDSLTVDIRFDLVQAA